VESKKKEKQVIAKVSNLEKETTVKPVPNNAEVISSSATLTRIIHSQILNLKRSHAKVGHINFTVIFFVSCIYLMIFLKFR
jgi:hypothetical protein